MSNAEMAFETVLPPRFSGKQAVQQATLATSTTSTAIAGSLGASAPDGKVYIEVIPIGGDAYIMFSTGGQSATTTNGWFIPNGQQRGFWVSPAIDTHMNHIGSAAGTIKWYVSSPEYERSKTG